MSTQQDSIDRREALRRVGALFGGVAFVGGGRLLEAFDADVHGRTAIVAQSAQGVGQFTPADIAMLDEVADTILPATSTPGAKAARTGAFMALMVTDTYQPADQKVFRDGMQKLDAASRSANGNTFVKATPAQRLAVLRRLDRESKTYMDARDVARAKAKSADQVGGIVTAGQPDVKPHVAADAPAHYFRMMKELACLGYFTSEIGCTQAQRYIETPTRYDPCVPYRRGEKAWASHA